MLDFWRDEFGALKLGFGLRLSSRSIAAGGPSADALKLASGDFFLLASGDFLLLSA